jgi:hypothetical protein
VIAGSFSLEETLTYYLGPSLELFHYDEFLTSPCLLRLATPLTEPTPLPKLGWGMSPHPGEVIETAYSEPWPAPENDALAPDIEDDPFPMYDDLLCLILF